jgi:hypothetical protein
MVDSSKTFVLLFSNKEEFTVQPQFVNLSKTFTNMLDDLDMDDEIITLPCSENWKNESYKELYKAYQILIEKQPDYFIKLEESDNYHSPENRCLTETEQELKFSPEQYNVLFEMLSIANYLDMNTFIQLMAKIIAHKINDARLSNEDSQIHDLLGNPNVELTTEEQKFMDEKKEVLETLQQNESASI